MSRLPFSLLCAETEREARKRQWRGDAETLTALGKEQASKRQPRWEGSSALRKRWGKQKDSLVCIIWMSARLAFWLSTCSGNQVRGNVLPIWNASGCLHCDAFNVISSWTWGYQNLWISKKAFSTLLFFMHKTFIACFISKEISHMSKSSRNAFLPPLLIYFREPDTSAFFHPLFFSGLQAYWGSSYFLCQHSPDPESRQFL